MLGNRLDAEEIVLDAFVRLADASVIERPDEEVAAWMRRVCLNLAANRLRDRKRFASRIERAAVLDMGSRAADADPTPDVEREETRVAVRLALADLPDRQRDCLLLRYAGHSYSEIAASLGVSVGSVGVLLARAERAFESAYQGETNDVS